MNNKGTIISITEKALKQIRAVVRQKNGCIGVRVSIVKGGCSGYKYKFEHATKILSSDETIVYKGVQVFLDRMAVLKLLGSTMDYQDNLISSGFTFKNPNIKGICGCGESISI